MGVSTESGAGRLLAPADVAVVDVGREPLWSDSRWVSLHECGVARRQRRVAFPAAAVVDGGILAECGGGRALCPASAPRGVGGLGDRKKGRAQRFLRLSLPPLLRPLCRSPKVEVGGPWSVVRGQYSKVSSSWSGARTLRHGSAITLLPPLPRLPGLRPDEQGHAGDLALRDAPARLLALATPSTCTTEQAKIFRSQASSFIFHPSSFAA